MLPLNNTILRKIGTIIVFGTFTAIFTSLSFALMAVGIWWALQVLYTVGWWATLAIWVALVIAYAFALSFGLSLIERENA